MLSRISETCRSAANYISNQGSAAVRNLNLSKSAEARATASALGAIAAMAGVAVAGMTKSPYCVFCILAGYIAFETLMVHLESSQRTASKH